MLVATILAAILDFYLIVGVGHVYPRYFLPSGDVVIKKTAVRIKMHTEPPSADGSLTLKALNYFCLNHGD